MRLLPSFQDQLACPECGALAERIGHYFDDHAGGEKVRGFQAEPVFASRKRTGEPYSAGDIGVEHMVVGTKEAVDRGMMVTKEITRDLLPITHWCTNPDCAVVFPKHMGGSYQGEMPVFAQQRSAEDLEREKSAGIVALVGLGLVDANRSGRVRWKGDVG